MEIQITENKYVVAHNIDESIIHLINATANGKLITQMEVINQYDTLAEAEAYIDGIKEEGYTKDKFKYLYPRETTN